MKGDAAAVGTSIAIVAGSDGSLVASVAFGSDTVLTRLDAAGRTVPGWPRTLRNLDECDSPLLTASGHVRIVCLEGESGLERAFGFTPDGTLEPGWPVLLDESSSAYAMTTIGEDLVVVAVEPGPGVDTVVRLVTIRPNGTTDAGVGAPSTEGSWAISPTGIAYGTADQDGATDTTVVAIDRTGVRRGWPIEISGIASAPALGPGDRITVVVGDGGSVPTRALVFGPDGQPDAASSDVLPAVPMPAVNGFDRPMSPVVAADGSTIVVTYDKVEGSAIVWALDLAGDVRTGWPYRPGAGIATQGICAADDPVGCRTARPAVGGDGSLVIPEPELNTSAGGRLVSLGQDGRPRAGWPVTLKRAGAAFWSVIPAGRGVAALSVEPEGGGQYSATVLWIARDSTVVYAKTILEP